MTSLNIDKWPIFSLLNPSFLCNIKSACVFGGQGNEALIVTRDGLVYGIGSNSSSCLATGDGLSTLEPRRIEALDKKGVISFAYGSGPHVLAITASGELFSWGHNGYCQLGNGSTNQCSTPFLINTNLGGKKVIAAACGSHHSMALTADGEIYAWGQNNCGQVGTGSTSNQGTPRRVTACIGSKRAVGIACGQTSSIAILDNGDVYSWGYNGNGQLGLGNNVNQPNPCRVTALQGTFIAQVVCGYAHTMALSDEGELYAWGANSYGQLGIGSKANVVSPIRIASEYGRFVEIAAIHYNHISAGLTQLGRVFMWGQCRSQSITIPMLTRFHSIHDVFASFGSPAVTWNSLDVEHSDFCKVAESLQRAFDDPNTADVSFLVQGREIHAHKAVLKIRCEHFRSMFNSDWAESDKSVIEIPQYSYDVYRAFIQYLYTDHLEVNPEDAIGLLDLANSYCEIRLKHICERIIRQCINVDNAAMLYATAIKYDAKDLQEFCFRFIINHMTAVVQSESFLHLEEAIMRSLVIKAAENGVYKY